MMSGSSWQVKKDGEYSSRWKYQLLLLVLSCFLLINCLHPKRIGNQWL